MFCNKCGNEMPDDSKFCLKCGTKVASLSADSNNQPSVQETLNINKKGSTITYIFYFISVVGLGFSNIANFIKYMKFGWFKMSLASRILMTVEDIEKTLNDTGEVIGLSIFIVSVICLILALIFGVFAKPQLALIFMIIGSLPFLSNGSAWVHYIGFGIAFVGLVGYLLSKKAIMVE